MLKRRMMNFLWEHSSLERCLWLLALGLIVFFGRWQVLGLQPDAALYAGLSLKVLRTGEYWLISGSPQRFPQFFEHPSYFFQWGAQVLRVLGTSDGAARSIGALPGFLGFLSVVFWSWWRLGFGTAALTALMLGSWGHYTKFATTSMMEGPLSLAVAWVAIAAVESHWRARSFWYRPLWWFFLYGGLLLATASKGLVGLGAWGGLVLSLVAALFLSPREPFKIVFSLFFIGIPLLVALSPLAFWAWQMWRNGGWDYITGYFFQQVLRSATTNRGEGFHASAGDKLYYLKLFLRDGWPWMWAVLGGVLCVLALKRFWRRPELEKFSNASYRAWTWNSLAFLLAFLVPFSFVHYQLPHYLHPPYVLLMTLGAFFLWSWIEPRAWSHWLLDLRLRWSLVLILGLGFAVFARGVSGHGNRGQPFIAVAEKILASPVRCKVLVPETEMDPYRQEAYALWYWQGREWEFTPDHLPRNASAARGTIYWEPETQRLLFGSGCAEGQGRR